MSENKFYFIVQDGCVSRVEGEYDEDDGDYIYFPTLDFGGIDYTNSDDSDECHIHLDNLHETEAAATAVVVRFCRDKIVEYNRKLDALLPKLGDDEWVDSHV